jgi:hypothetical protein
MPVKLYGDPQRWKQFRSDIGRIVGRYREEMQRSYKNSGPASVWPPGIGLWTQVKPARGERCGNTNSMEFFDFRDGKEIIRIGKKAPM